MFQKAKTNLKEKLLFLYFLNEQNICNSSESSTFSDLNSLQLTLSDIGKE